MTVARVKVGSEVAGRWFEGGGGFKSLETKRKKRDSNEPKRRSGPPTHATAGGSILGIVKAYNKKQKMPAPYKKHARKPLGDRKKIGRNQGKKGRGLTTIHTPQKGNHNKRRTSILKNNLKKQ